MKLNLFAGAAVATLFIAGAAAAAPMTYTDRATFETAIGGPDGSENFNSFASDATFHNATVTAGFMQISGEPGANGALTNKIDASSFELAGNYDINGSSYLLGDLTGAEKIRIDFLVAIRAWGGDFLGISDGPRTTRMDFFDAGDALIGSMSFSSTTLLQRDFYGIDLDGAVAAYAILGFNGLNNDVFGIDNIIHGAPEIPLPAAAPIFLAGLAGLGIARRRRRAAR